MAYKNTFKGYLNSEKIKKCGIERAYKLSYEFTPSKDKFLKKIFKKGKSKEELSKTPTRNPCDLFPEDLTKYINDNYLEKDVIEKEKLINDLVVFKSYKAYIEEFAKKEGSFSNYISEISNLFIGLSAVIIAMGKDEYTVTNNSTIKNVCFIVKSKQPKDFIDLFHLFLFLMLIRLVIYILVVSKRNYSERLKTANNAIYILEALKEEIYNNPECRIEDKKDEDQEIKSEDSIEITKPEDSTEDTENDNAIEKEIIKVEIIDYSDKFEINFIKGASCIAVLLLSIAKVFGKKK